ncbi:B-cell receptor CD22-like [Pygocentrus nattereri]|uniref:B-cell receptor CD22-like n=1 Tax=Pygocentrus nattereri TaxID=42514 RepID=UPI0018912D42|nr:B-cell receptor CD22-like [Pygocentrus nattereri]
MSLTVSLLVLLFISGVVAQDGWGVDYKDQYICALKGSTVTMRCTYTYPSGPVVQKAFWTKQWGQDLQVEVPERVIEGDEVTLTCKTTCSLTVRPTFTWYRKGHPLSSRTDQLHLQPVSREDADRYRCAVLGLRSPEVTLNVRYLQVEVPERVIEGDEVTLTCKTSFSLSYRPTFTWYRNGHYLSSRTDQLHLQPVSSDNKDRYRCAVLGLRSPEVTLNVRYGPKSISVSISPSGEIVEGSSVTLTCSSDGNPPVEYNWIKGTSSVGKGKTYTMKKISSVDSGEYKCRSSNEHGEKLSEALTLNVLYGPKSVSVSVSPSGEIVEGRSVNLTCSSDANPPVQNYTWIKGTSSVGKGETYTMKKISSVDSGEYKCRSSNEHGEKLSEALTLNVLYPPKSVSVSISPSSETAEGSSVNLTCSSDANPPVQNYTWFKEGGSSPVGSGHSYMAPQRGSYYCEAQNEHGSQKSAAVTVKGVWNSALYAVIGVTAGCGCLSLIIAVFCVRRKRRDNSADDADQTQENLYSNVAVRPATSDAAPDPDPSNQDDVHYASVGPRKPRNPRNAESSAGTASAFGADEEVQYASVQHRSDKVVQKTEVDAQYASVRFSRTGAANRAARSTLEDPSVIYCSVK